MIRRIAFLGLLGPLFACSPLTSVALADFPLMRHTNKIDADPGKQYPLGREHGPWMIMAATFHATGADGETDEGKSPEQAAQELILELRQKGIPAYLYVSQGKSEKIETTDRAGRKEVRKPLRRVTSVCVLAGNYTAINDEKAQKTLKWVKTYKAKSLSEGVTYNDKDGRGPLAGSFLAINPLLSPEEVQSHSVDPFVISLNSGMRNGLFENKGKYTLVVASFGGKNVFKSVKDKLPGADEFLKKSQENESDLDDAAENALHLAQHLRGETVIRCAPNEEVQHKNIDAFVWHDQYKSIVTVGQFDSPNDPMIQKYRTIFAAKNVTDPRGGETHPELRFLAVKGYGKDADQFRMWIFDPNPQLMPVPRKR
jgi:hypothetical protein